MINMHLGGWVKAGRVLGADTITIQHISQSNQCPHAFNMCLGQLKRGTYRILHLTE